MKRDDSHFRVDGLRSDLRGRSVRAGVATAISQGSCFVINLGGTMVLARLLTPADFGLIAMVMSIVGFFVIFRDLGLTTATVQREEIDQEKVSTLFWINAAAGLIIAAVIMAAAPLVARFFDEPRLMPVAVVIGSLSLLHGLGAQQYALLRRQMRFGRLAVVEVASVLAGTVAAILFALRGFDYWALVIQQGVGAIVRVVLLWSLCNWRPSAVFRPADARPMIAFGGYLTLSRLTRFATRSVDRVLLGRLWGAGVLGLYAKANGWIVSPFQQITFPLSRVANPVLSRLTAEPARYRAYFRQGMELVAIVGVPMIVFLLLEADSVILVLLGDQWIDAIPIFRLLAPVAFFTLLRIGIGWAYVSSGRAKRQLLWEIAASITTLTGFAVGIRWGAMGVAAGYSVASVLLAVPGAIYCFRGTPLRMGDLFGPYGMPAVAALLGAVCVRAIAPVLPAGALLELACSGAVFGVVYAGAWWITPRGRNAVRRVLRLGRDVLPARRA